MKQKFNLINQLGEAKQYSKQTNTNINKDVFMKPKFNPINQLGEAENSTASKPILKLTKTYL